MEHLLKFTDEEKITLIRSRKASIPELNALSKDDDWVVRWNVAAYLMTPVDILKSLSKDKDWFVKMAVIENPNVTVDIIEDVAKDIIDKSIINDKFLNKLIQSIVKNEKTPAYLLERLSKSDDAYTRWYLAGNINTPIEILKELSNNNEIKPIKEAVIINPSVTTEILKDMLKNESKETKLLIKMVLEERGI